ncbi:unnamed protein product [Adineta steineri]|uniref:Uncharacterized protein n=1 Tax=Adineta steineri TaxID=433720 RepID=A0A819X5I5_9BILA|nr:unnamed protein product [Adineta steineri]CAF4132534.1 unnamed protein product [Adineta steineri]
MSAVMIDEYPTQLFETNIFKNFTQNDFNDKFHIDEISGIKMDEAAVSVGQLLKNHKLLDLLGVCNIHNHFHLKENEIVLAKASVANDNDSISHFDINMTSPSYLHLKATNLDSNMHPVPYMWAYDKQSKMFFALQFFDGSNKEMKDRFQKLTERSESLINFYQEFVQLAENLGLEDNLGIYLLYADIINKKLSTEEFREITDTESREQWVYTTPADKFKQSIPTHWTFSADCDGIIEVVCMQMCSNKTGTYHDRVHHKLG